ncbi:MAG: 4-alpha-glucanotransferase [Deltaproteobacteria bacterium]|jgi:4-alpha-glucanotransferase|nr:4-alpha-glucanotransferase [Deltaproteobacteria bacterium]
MSRFDEGWRAAGLLVPLSALPTPYGAGDFGPDAVKLARFASGAGAHFWQILPVNPTAPSLGNSPYSGFSAYAVWELYASPEILFRDGLLDRADLRGLEIPPGPRVDYPRVIAAKKEALDRAFRKAEGALLDDPDFRGFLAFNGSWLDDYALFSAAKDRFGGSSWTAWPDDLKDRREDALRHWGTALSREILRVKFGQWRLFGQLTWLKARLADLRVGLIGDAAFYVSHDSADVWANRGLFALDHSGETGLMAGVPPDYYSDQGQLWGNPVYDWPRHRDQGYAWWSRRILHNLGLFDWTRLDHFRAFAACWTVKPDGRTARFGEWLPGPGRELFDRVAPGRGLNIIAEDLGVITPDVTELRKSRDFPGMRVLQFGAGDPAGLSSHCPFRIEPDNVAYSSTHDSNTARGWYSRELDIKGRRALDLLAGRPLDYESAARALVTLAWCSPAAIAVTTLQDLLNLDQEHRMNLPGSPAGNWEWRLGSFAPLTERLAGELAELGAAAGRDNWTHPNTLTYEAAAGPPGKAGADPAP